MQLSNVQVRAMSSLSTARGPMTRQDIANRAFNGNSVNFAPILDPLVDAGMIVARDLENADTNRTEKAFVLTEHGRQRLAQEEQVPSATRQQTVDRRQLKVGDRLIKDYQGETHTVLVTERGFEYGGSLYSSLTAVAKAVKRSDVEVNGWAFFGLA